MMKELNWGIRVFLGVGLCWISTSAAEFSVKSGDKAAPSEVAEPIRDVLSAKPIQLLDGDKPVLQIWLRDGVALKSKPTSPSAALNVIPEAALIGVVSVEGEGLRDYKENDVPKGVFTARFIMQPQDGDHLGTAEFSTFVALVPLNVDKALDTFTKYTPLVKASGKLTSSGHPLIISLRPVSSRDGKVPAVTEPAAEHKAIRLKIQGKTGDGETVEIPFELVFEGHGHTQ